MSETEDKIVGEVMFYWQLEKDSPKLPFTVKLMSNPPRVIVTVENCMPVIFTAQQLALITIHTHKKYLDQNSQSKSGQKE